jgi:hypothetical protein
MLDCSNANLTDWVGPASARHRKDGTTHRRGPAAAEASGRGKARMDRRLRPAPRGLRVPRARVAGGRWAALGIEGLDGSRKGPRHHSRARRTRRHPDYRPHDGVVADGLHWQCRPRGCRLQERRCAAAEPRQHSAARHSHERSAQRPRSSSAAARNSGTRNCPATPSSRRPLPTISTAEPGHRSQSAARGGSACDEQRRPRPRRGAVVERTVDDGDQAATPRRRWETAAREA